jgi:hypothetical protein
MSGNKTWQVCRTGGEAAAPRGMKISHRTEWRVRFSDLYFLSYQLGKRPMNLMLLSGFEERVCVPE